MAKTEIITLDGTVTSTLDWAKHRKNALQSIGAGKQILWHLEMGLFSQLNKPLTDSTQFQTLGLAIDHFRDTLWKEFHGFTLGLSLYKGPSPTLQERDIWGDYLEQLAGRMPDEIKPYIIFDSLPNDIILKALLTHPERYERFTIQADYAWRTGETVEKAICFPPLTMTDLSLLEPFRPLLEKGLKIIPEERLTYSWDGLNTLYYSKSCISPAGFRKLNGFKAAGGEIIDI